MIKIKQDIFSTRRLGELCLGTILDVRSFYAVSTTFRNNHIYRCGNYNGPGTITRKQRKLRKLIFSESQNYKF